MLQAIAQQIMHGMDCPLLLKQVALKHEYVRYRLLAHCVLSVNCPQAQLSEMLRMDSQLPVVHR